LGLVETELRRIIRPPFEVIVVLVGNGLLATALWLFSPVGLSDLVFSVHSEFLFPTVLASWMLADVPATNQLAPDGAEVIRRLDDPEAITMLLRAKQTALWLLVTPVSLAAAIWVGIDSNKGLTIALTVAWVATVPLAGLGLSCFIGVRWPYHPIPLKERWAQRRRWRTMLLRWGILVLLPYGLVPLVGLIALIPPGIIYALFHGSASVTHDEFRAIFVGGLVAIPLAVWIWRWGTARAGRLAYERRDALVAYLSDPSLG
jgi:hypothetical protein